ncbi:hypothetical protein [Streptomyces sp. NPDC059165]|uniref:hypothetical protein n=1 Tax=Streptomyces sp. NPDC059165 TaxID=3346751 RepID=UPI0036A14385
MRFRSAATALSVGSRGGGGDVLRLGFGTRPGSRDAELITGRAVRRAVQTVRTVRAVRSLRCRMLWGLPVFPRMRSMLVTAV